jgi:hypothetical protein
MLNGKIFCIQNLKSVGGDDGKPLPVQCDQLAYIGRGKNRSGEPWI